MKEPQNIAHDRKKYREHHGTQPAMHDSSGHHKISVFLQKKWIKTETVFTIKKKTYTQKIQCPTIHVMKFEATLNTKKCTHSHCKLEIFQIPSVLFLSQPEETKQHQNLCKKAFMPKIDNGHSIRFKAIPNWKNTHPNTHIHTKRAKKRVLWNLPDSRQARKRRWNGEDPYLETEIAGLSKKIRRL